MHGVRHVISTAIPLTYMLPILRELERHGHSRSAVLREAGLQGVRGSVAALPVRQFTHLYGCAIRLLESETSRRIDHSIQSKEITDLLCHCVVSCQKLGDVIERAAAFNRVLGPMGGSLELVCRDRIADLIVDSHRASRDTGAFLVDLASMLFYHQLFSLLIGERIQLLGAVVMYSPPTRPMPITELLGVPIGYGASENRLTLRADYLARPVVRSGAELAQSQDYFPFPFDVWIGEQARGALHDRLRILLMSILQHGEMLPDRAKAAQLLGCRATTLHRRLIDSGTSYARIRTACRREWAEHQLIFTRTPLREIASELGFSDDRSFRRAFHKWVGCGPGEFRRSRGIRGI